MKAHAVYVLPAPVAIWMSARGSAAANDFSRLVIASIWQPRIPSVGNAGSARRRSEEHTSELQSQSNLVCRLLLEKKKHITSSYRHTVIIIDLQSSAIPMTYPHSDHTARSPLLHPHIPLLSAILRIYVIILSHTTY